MQKQLLVPVVIIALLVIGLLSHKSKPVPKLIATASTDTNHNTSVKQIIEPAPAALSTNQTNDSSIAATPPAKKANTSFVERGVHITSPPAPTQGRTNIILFRAKAKKTNEVDPRNVTVVVGE